MICRAEIIVPAFLGTLHDSDINIGCIVLRTYAVWFYWRPMA
jgi:hypothetical protein